MPLELGTASLRGIFLGDKMRIHAMCDLETVDNRPSAAILQVGIVKFTSKEILEKFKLDIYVPTQLELGRTMNFDTICWWAGQKHMKETFDKCNNPDTSVTPSLAAMQMVNFFLNDGKEMAVWSNGVDFDTVILESYFETFGHKAPWKFWNKRCYKTIKRMFNVEGNLKREGTHHTAIDDAIHQTKGIQAFLQKYPQLDC